MHAYELFGFKLALKTGLVVQWFVCRAAVSVEWVQFTAMAESPADDLLLVDCFIG